MSAARFITRMELGSGRGGGIHVVIMHRGCHPGQEHRGRTEAAYGKGWNLNLVLLLGRQLDSRLGLEPEIGVCNSTVQKSMPQPQQPRRV